MRLLYVTIYLIFVLAVPAAALDQGLARQVLAEINQARSAPRTYAGFLREFRGLFHGTFYQLPGSSTRMLTTEGAKAVDEAVRFLLRQKPLPPLA